MRPHRLVLPVTVLALAAACGDATPSAPVAGAVAAPELRSQREGAIEGQYIVVFEDDVAEPRAVAQRLAAQHGAAPFYTYTAALKGFAVRVPAQAAEALARNPEVAYVEQDQVVAASETQAGATWGLDRIDQRDLPLSTTYTYGATGAGVTAYIIDTGILTSHSDLGGRATTGFDAFGGSAQDCNGHGTHVAGTVGGGTWGVAKGVALVAVRVLDCGGSGTTSGVIAGIDWVRLQTARPAVANMSLGGGYSSSLNTAVANAVASGVTFAVAAGNGNFLGIAQDACNYSPASTPSAITVGATTSTDAKASYSNYGSCVDLHAPGSGITSAWYTSTTATRTISGTSMATPHVAGAAALYLQGNSTASPSAVASALVGSATLGKITSLPAGTANRLLFVGEGGSGGGGGTTDAPPVASISKSCAGFTCTFRNTSTDDGTVSVVEWTVDGVSAGAEPQIQRTFSARSSHSVQLTVRDDADQTSVATVNVSCNQKKCS